MDLLAREIEPSLAVRPQGAQGAFEEHSKGLGYVSGAFGHFTFREAILSLGKVYLRGEDTAGKILEKGFR